VRACDRHKSDNNKAPTNQQSQKEREKGMSNQTARSSKKQTNKPSPKHKHTHASKTLQNYIHARTPSPPLPTPRGGRKKG
jgi:hypothetical protein